MTLSFRLHSACALAAVLFLGSFAACALPEGPRLVAGGYGYTVGDIVEIDAAKEPAVGDIVQYDDRKNNSDFAAFGPGYYLAKIVGLPGDNVSFNETYYEVNGLKVELGSFGRAKWGDRLIANIVGMNLTVPENEFLVDIFVGFEHVGTQEENGSPGYARYTIKREAITGVITSKLGHDQKFEDEQKQIVY